MTWSDGTITLKVHNCGFLDVSNYSENLGNKHCSVCLTGALNMGLLKALNLADTKDLRVEKKETDCTINLTSD